MPEREVDLWETSSGLPDDFAFTVTNARFVFDPQYNNGETLLLAWEGEAEGVDLDRPLRFACGSGWDTPDNGKTAVHPKQKLFNKRSHYGMLIDRCIKELGMGDILRRRGVPTEAKVWVGLRFRLPRVRGDRPLSSARRRRRSWAPPRARGSTRRMVRLHRRAGGSPACAGIDPAAGRRACRTWGLPRVRGDRPGT